MGKKNSFCLCDRCPRYELCIRNNFDHRKDMECNNQNNRQSCYTENVSLSVSKLIKENEKYFIYEVERITFDCIVHDNSYLKTMGYDHRIAYEIFEKYGIFMHVSDLVTYVNSPRDVKQELQRLISKYGSERITEEIAICLRSNYPGRFGIDIVKIV